MQYVNLSDSSQSEEFEGHCSDPESEFGEIKLENRPQKYPRGPADKKSLNGAIPREAVDFV